MRHLVIGVLLGLAVALPLTLVVPPAPAENDCKVIEDFTDGPAGEFPPDWKPRKDSGKGEQDADHEVAHRTAPVQPRGHQWPRRHQW